jgi:hypothetical protein
MIYWALLLADQAHSFVRRTGCHGSEFVALGGRVVNCTKWMVRLEPSTALTPTSNWMLGFQSVDDWGSSMKPVACFNVARPAEKAGSSGGRSPAATFAL